MLHSQTLQPNARLIVIGDIHGCYVELRELVDLLAPDANDVVVSVGDIVTKGPHVERCLEFWRERGHLAVQGNNELKVLRDKLLRPDLQQYIASWPLVIDFPGERVSVVHGGFLPQMQVTPADVERERDSIPELRWIRKSGDAWRPVPKQLKRPGDVLWSEEWRGDRFVLYGHTPVREPKRDPQALGLDTGCVYGGALTAAVYAAGAWTTTSVNAKRKYV